MGVLVDKHLDINHDYNQNFHLKPIERRLEKEWEELAQKINSEVVSIELIIAHQRSMGNHILTLDNITARKVTDLIGELSQMKQETFTAKDKRVWQWTSVAINFVAGCCGIGGGGGAIVGASKNIVDALKTASEAGRPFASAADTMGQMSESTHQVSHTKIDHETQHGRTQKEAHNQSEHRMKGANDNISSILAKYYEALYQLRIALARMT